MKEKSLLAKLFALAAIACGLNAVQGQPVLQFSAASYSVTENEPFATLWVFRTGTTEVPVSVQYLSSNATALAAMDYAETSGTLEFANGQTNQTISIPILNDAVIEPVETFNVELKNPGGGAVLGARTNAAVRITDNDKGLRFEFGSYRVNEDAGSVLIGVKRADDGVNPVTVDYGTSDVSATGDADYSPVTGTLSFAEGQRLQLLTVPILNDG
jgi:hypothetical protein